MKILALLLLIAVVFAVRDTDLPSKYERHGKGYSGWMNQVKENHESVVPSNPALYYKGKHMEEAIKSNGRPRLNPSVANNTEIIRHFILSFNKAVKKG